MQTVPERYRHSGQVSFEESSRRYQALLHTADLAAQCSFPELLKEISKSVHDLFPFDFLNYALYSASRKSMIVQMLGGDAAEIEQSAELPVEGSPSGWVWSNQQPLILKQRGSRSSLSSGVGFFQMCCASCGFMLRLRTHEEMAQRIGASRETVTRLLSELKKKDLIKLEGTTLVIKNRTALEALAM
jgi:hypothetical protein